MNRRIGLFLMALGFFAAGCGEGEKPLPSAWKNTENALHIDVNSPFDSLSPDVDASGSTHVFPLLYSFLFVPSAQGELAPDLALRWEYDPARFSWTIHLRSDARFHTGLSVTARDVEYSFRLLTAKSKCFLSSSVDRIQVPSGDRLVFFLHADDPDFLKKIWDISILPAPERGGAIDFLNRPVGSGPFRFKGRAGHDMVILEANPDYYAGPPELSRIYFHFVRDLEASWRRLIDGETDIVTELTPQNRRMMQRIRERFYLNEYVLPYYAILLYNTHHPLFLDPNVRRALGMAIDRRRIVDMILEGAGRIANGPMGVDSPYHDPGAAPLPYDPAGALTLLEAAGWSWNSEHTSLIKSDIPFSFELRVNDQSEIEMRVARFVMLSLHRIGIQVHLVPTSFSDIFQRYYCNTDFEAVLTELSGAYRNPENVIDLFCPVSASISAVEGFDAPEVTGLIHYAMNGGDGNSKKAVFYRIESRINALQPGTFLYHKTAFDALSRRILFPAPFSGDCSDFYRLRFARLAQNAAPLMQR